MRGKLCGLVVLLAMVGSGCAAGPRDQRYWGSFTERGLSNVPMKPGTNVRVFNDVSLEDQPYIKYDKATGYLTLEPGTYRVDGWSLTTFGWMLSPAQQAATFSAPGYAFLWNVDAKKVELLASLRIRCIRCPATSTGSSR